MITVIRKAIEKILEITITITIARRSASSLDAMKAFEFLALWRNATMQQLLGHRAIACSCGRESYQSQEFRMCHHNRVKSAATVKARIPAEYCLSAITVRSLTLARAFWNRRWMGKKRSIGSYYTYAIWCWCPTTNNKLQKVDVVKLVKFGVCCIGVLYDVRQRIDWDPE